MSAILKRVLGDPWRLVVSGLVAANLAALGGVGYLIHRKNEAVRALREAEAMLSPDRPRDPRLRRYRGVVFRELARLHEIYAMRRRSGLEGTEPEQITRYIFRCAQEAGLDRRDLQITNTTRTARKGVVSYETRISFDRQKSFPRDQIAYFLFRIKLLTPQLKIVSIDSGRGAVDDPEKADQWAPRILLVLTKEEAPAD